MKKVIVYICGLFFLCFVSCCGVPIPVYDYNYKDSVTDYSWFEFNDKIYLLGGEYWKTTSKELNMNLFDPSLYDYNYQEIPNETVYVCKNSEELSFYLAFQSMSLDWINFSEWGFEKYGKVSDENLNRYNRYFIEYKDRIWLIGGENILDSYEKYNDVFVSDDGLNWEIALTDAPWAHGSFRTGHRLFVWKDQLWLLGGFTNEGTSSEIWVTSDGKHWNRTASFPELEDIGNIHTFKENLYFRGEKKEDSGWYTYVSADGTRWEQIEDRWNGWDYDDNLYFEFGDNLYSATSSGLWISEDVLNWRELFNSSDFSNDILIRGDEAWITDPFLLDYRIAVSKDLTSWRVRGQNKSFTFLPADEVPYEHDDEYDYDLIEFRDYLWILTGHPEGTWRSEDGLDWEQIRYDKNSSWKPRNNSSIIQYNHRLWMMGGRQRHNIDLGEFSDSAYNALNDVLFSEDGLNWETALPEAPWFRRWDMQTIVWNNELYMIGGISYENDYCEIWKRRR